MTGNTTCTAPNEPAGTYYDALFAVGNVSGSTFSLDSSQTNSNTYELVTLVAATPLPTPSPQPSVTFSPQPVPSFTPGPTATVNPMYVYIGEYATTSGTHPTTGCIVLDTTQNGSPFAPGISDNAVSEGFIQYDSSMLSPQSSPPPGMGTITALTVSGLSPTGGSGTFTLSDGTTGSIAITGRDSIMDYERRHPARRARSTRFPSPF